LILSDTNIIIYILEGDKTLAELFDHNIISISFITELELLTAKNYTAGQLGKINALIERVSIYNYNELIKQPSIPLA
jgi:predicted nucleic acid-binding protein